MCLDRYSAGGKYALWVVYDQIERLIRVKCREDFIFFGCDFFFRKMATFQILGAQPEKKLKKILVSGFGAENCAFSVDEQKRSDA